MEGSSCKGDLRLRAALLILQFQKWESLETDMALMLCSPQHEQLRGLAVGLGRHWQLCCETCFQIGGGGAAAVAALMGEGMDSLVGCGICAGVHRTQCSLREAVLLRNSVRSTRRFVYTCSLGQALGVALNTSRPVRLSPLVPAAVE